MKTINEQEFRVMCDTVRTLAPSILNGVMADNDKTDRLLGRLFTLVCQHLELDPGEQHRVLKGPAGFDLTQILDERMNPEFSSSKIIDEHLLMQI